MMEWNRNVSMRALRAFSVAAERLSFRLAADDLFITASAISHQIKLLEAEIGKPLFRRLPRGLELTAAGKALQKDLQPALEALDQVVLQHCGRGDTAELRIAVRPLFANELLMPRLREFLEQNPELRIRVETSEDADSDDAASDACIRLFAEEPATGEWDLLFPVSHIPIGSVDLYSKIKVVGGRIRDPFPLIVHDGRPNDWRDWQKQTGLKLPRDCPVIELNSSLAVSRAAEQGLGAALLPGVLCTPLIERGAVVPLFDQALDADEGFYFGSSRPLRDDPAFSQFHAWVLQEFVTDG